MKRVSVAVLGWMLLSCALTASGQQKLAHLDHDVAPDLPRASASLHDTSPARTYSSQPVKLEDTPLSRSAARALFVRYDLTAARSLAAEAVRKHPNDLEALFISMEVAAFRSDTPAMLEHALALCEFGGAQSQNLRVELAAIRVREAASNTPAFRQVIPRIQHLLANSRQPWLELSEALLRAAMDGVPGLEPYSLARSSGILTDWRIVGPLNRRALAGAEPDAVSRNDSLSQPIVQGRAVENFQFPDGMVELPDYLARRGTFYAATQFATLGPGVQCLRVNSQAALDVYVDGTLSLHAVRANSEAQRESSLDLPAGPHRVLVRFDGGAAAFRLQITSQPSPGIHPEQRVMLVAEGTYLREQLQSAESRLSRANSPSYCSTVLSAFNSYRSSQSSGLVAAMARQLDACAPESLAFAEALSAEGQHLASAAALRKITSAAPLNRAARLMLVRELQLSGDDSGAQQAAANWMRIAPNASSYRRMAASAEDDPDSTSSDAIPFYMPFRREISAPNLTMVSGDEIMVLLNDSAAIARPDGSVSLYVHRTVRALSDKSAEELGQALPPKNAQAVTLRVVTAGSSSSAWTSNSALHAGDTLDVEYVLNYLGDGGISKHPEIFQHVFGPSPSAALQERFVVLLPAAESDRGVVIVTGNAPKMTTRLSGRMLARIWEEDRSAEGEHENFSVVRVVEQENGWSTPRSAEKRRKIETAHPGPRLIDATLLPTDAMGSPSTGN